MRFRPRLRIVSIAARDATDQVGPPAYYDGFEISEGASAAGLKEQVGAA